MVEYSIARHATVLLSTAIASIFESVNPGIAVALRDEALTARAHLIEAMGADVAVLAAAIGVLTRRSGPEAQA